MLTLPFDPCGWCLDLRRSAAVERCYPWFNSSDYVLVRWFRLPIHAAKPLPFEHSFTAPIWLPDKCDDEMPLGQVGFTPKPSIYDKGAMPFRLVIGDKPCGAPEKYLNGFDRNIDLPLEFDDEGISTCCRGGVVVWTDECFADCSLDGRMASGWSFTEVAAADCVLDGHSFAETDDKADCVFDGKYFGETDTAPVSLDGNT